MPRPPTEGQKNQRMMIKVRLTDCQLFACIRIAQTDFVEERYYKKYQLDPTIRNLISVSKMAVRLTVCSLCILNFCNISYFPFWF